jgi:protein TIF31
MADNTKEAAKVEQIDDQAQNENNNTEEENQEPVAFNIHVVSPKQEKIPLQVTAMDSVQDIRQFLLEAAETGHITSYHLELAGQRVSDYVDLSEVADLKEDAELVMVEDSYDDRSARYHVRRLRELLTQANNTLPAQSPSLFSELTNESLQFTGLVTEGDRDEVQLEFFYPTAGSQAAQPCLQKISFSGWNPAPSNRKLLGDLFYLDITTLEGKSVTVTAWANGFFVNGCTATQFNPEPAAVSYESHALVDLLNSLSPQFKTNYEQLLKKMTDRHPFEMMPVPFPVTPWLGKRNKHTFDFNRSEDALLASNEVEYNIQGQLRDWNEELQTCRELPKSTIQERITRDRAIFRVYTDFIDSATKGAMSIINGSVPPINPMDAKKSHLYIYNNIFFSYALDGRETFKEVGGDVAAYKNINNDLLGVKMVNTADVEGLYTVASAVIDYRGYRVMAQSIIPGLFSGLLAQSESNSIVAYGSMEGQEIRSDPEFHELIKKAGQKLNLKEHVVVDKNDKQHNIAGTVEVKGIKGSDGRHYVLDLVRVTPRDVNYPKKEHQTCLLRPELIQRYIAQLILIEASKNMEEKRKAKAAEIKAKEAAGEKVEETPEKDEDIELPEVHFEVNADVFTDHKLGDAEDVVKADQAMVTKLSNYLKNDIIPSLVEELSMGQYMPVDGQTLAALVHNRGVNLRYLGYIAKLAGKLAPVIRDMCMREMITRVSKHILNENLIDTASYNIAPAVAHFLNAYFGKVSGPNKGSRSGLVTDPVKAVESVSSPVQQQAAPAKKGKKGEQGKDAQATEVVLPAHLQRKAPKIFELTHNNLWAQIRKMTQEKYDFELPETIPSNMFDLPTLRSLCQKTGIQLHARNYDLNREKAFNAADILDIFPVVKHAVHKTNDGQDLLEMGRNYVQQGRLDTSFELLTESLALFHQVYGPISREAAQCYSNMAMVLYQAGDVAQAISHQEKAVIINERCLGLDSYETAHACGNLALFYHHIGKTKAALNFIMRALYLNYLTNGDQHADNAGTFSNLALVLGDLKAYDQSIDFLHRAAKCYETTHGPNSIVTANAYHSLAIAYSYVENFREALAWETKNYKILKDLVGEKHNKTMESNIWLKQFTSKAVAKAKTDRIQEVKKANFSSVLHRDARSSAEPAVSSTLETPKQLGTLPLAEVMNYINAPSSKSKVGSSGLKKGGRTTQTQPKNRFVQIHKAVTVPQKKAESTPAEHANGSNTNAKK